VNRSHTVAFAAEARSEPASATSKAAFGRNEIYHLLSGSNGNRYEAHKLAIVAGKLSEAAQNGADLHTLVIDGRLAAWGFSRLVQETADSASKGVVLPPGSAVLFELDAVPGATAALTHLITHIASERIREGATDVCLIAVDPDRATTRAIHGAGFQPSHTRVSTRVWRWEWQSSRSAEAVKA